MHKQRSPSGKDRVNTAILRILPQHLLARGMYHLARNRWQPLQQVLIRFVAKRYRVDLSEAEESDPSRYHSFNAFFTRALRAGVRPVASSDDAIVSPADGRISQIGVITNGRLLQAKGHDFDLSALLAGDDELTAVFQNGRFATIYLSPRDYHRVHMPLRGCLTRMDFVPGELFSVSEGTTQLVPGLFARNERVICVFATDYGPMVVILVGAIFVGSMETVWAGEIRAKSKHPVRHDYPQASAPTLEKGDELGRFNMGSTVIVLLPSGVAEWGQLAPREPVRMGQQIGTLSQSGSVVDHVK